MKQKEFEKARELYFQTKKTKTQIAAEVGVNRRTVLLWCKQDNWERMRRAEQTMPSLIAEKIYVLLDNYLNDLLRCPDWTHVGSKNAQTIYYLTSSIKKLKNRYTVNETLETFGTFLDGLRKHKPELAEQLRPEFEEFTAARALKQVSDHYMDGINEQGILYTDPSKPDEGFLEEQQDKADLDEFDEEYKRAKGNYDQAIENWVQKPNANIWPNRNPPPPTTDPNTTGNTTENATT